MIDAKDFVNRLERLKSIPCLVCEKIGEQEHAQETKMPAEEFEGHGTTEKGLRHKHFASVWEYSCPKGHRWKERQFSHCWCGWSPKK